MLIIAMPKTASTSLIMTIEDCQNQYAIGKFIKGRKNNKEYTELRKFHSNITNRTEQELNDLIKDKSMIYREHLIPTKEHLNILQKYSEPIIILLRNPDHVFDCYIRNEEIIELRKVNKEKLLNELNIFYKTYLDFSKQRKNTHVIFFKDIVLTPNKILKGIFKAFNIDKFELKELRKELYTGIGIKRLK